MNGITEDRSADDRVLDVIFNPELPAGGTEYEEEGSIEMVKVVVETPEVKTAKELEVSAVRTAEAGEVIEALQLLTEAITMAPNYASPYNNRAQVYRLQGNIELALQDLDSALELCGGRGKVAENALCQRGLIYRLHGNEDGARADFQLAAKMGNKFSQKQLVQMNPYSALCGKMLSEAFNKIRRGEDESDQ